MQFGNRSLYGRASESEVQLRHRHPIADLLDLLGRRWALRVLWELRHDGAQPFSELRAACDEMSTSVLTQRLRELVDAGIAERRDRAYALTPAGRELLSLLAPLDAWAKTWAQAVGRAGPPAPRSG